MFGYRLCVGCGLSVDKGSFEGVYSVLVIWIETRYSSLSSPLKVYIFAERHVGWSDRTPESQAR